MRRFLLAFFIGGLPLSVYATPLNPPFNKGDILVLTRGYDTPRTHVEKDRYALDFSKNGCGAYGAPTLTVGSGKATKVNNEDEWGKGYGFYVIVTHVDGTESRYAHLSRTLVAEGAQVSAGELIGLIGNTGNVFGSSCPAHKGTHLHFVMYKNGQAYRPEPMQSCTIVSSGATPCVNFAAGEWYRHDVAVVEAPKQAPQEISASAPQLVWFKLWEGSKDLVGTMLALLKIAWAGFATLFIDTNPDNDQASIFAAITPQQTPSGLSFPDIPPLTLPLSSSSPATQETPQTPAPVPDAHDTDIPDAHDTGVAVDNDDNNDDVQEVQNVPEVQQDESSSVPEVPEVQETQEDESSNEEVQSPSPSFGIGRPYGPLGPGATSDPNVIPPEPSGPAAPYLLALTEPESDWGPSHPTIAAGASSYLLAWSEARFVQNEARYDYRLRGRMLNAFGNAQGEPFTIVAGAPDEVIPVARVAGNSDAFLVVWYRTKGREADIFGVRISAEGALLDQEPIPIAASPNQSESSAEVSASGSGFLVAWQVLAPSPAWGGALAARFIEADGTLGTFYSLTSGIFFHTPFSPVPVCAPSGEHCLIAFTNASSHYSYLRVLALDLVAAKSSCTVVGWCPIVAVSPWVAANRFAVFDGTQYMLVWREGDGPLRAQRFTSLGVRFDATPYDILPSNGAHPIRTPLAVRGPQGLALVFRDTVDGLQVVSRAALEITPDEISADEPNVLAEITQTNQPPNDAACGAETCIVILQQGREVLIIPF